MAGGTRLLYTENDGRIQTNVSSGQVWTIHVVPSTHRWVAGQLQLLIIVKTKRVRVVKRIETYIQRSGECTRGESTTRLYMR